MLQLYLQGHKDLYFEGGALVAFMSGSVCFFWGIASCPVFNLVCVRLLHA